MLTPALRYAANCLVAEGLAALVVVSLVSYWDRWLIRRWRTRWHPRIAFLTRRLSAWRSHRRLQALRSRHLWP